MNKETLLIIFAIIGAIVIFFVILFNSIHSRKNKKYKKIIDDLEYQKNQIDTSPVGPELAKIEAYLNNQKLEVLYDDWKERLNEIKEEKIPKITDMLIEAEYSLSKADYKSTMYKIAKLEMEIYKIRTKSEFLLDEIKEVTNSEERNRAVITKLKAKYRNLLESFVKSKSEFSDLEPNVELQFDNIYKKFEDFEDIMEKNEYTEVGTIVNAIEEMLKHMETVIEELPSIILLAKCILPKKIEEITKIYNKMTEKGYPLDYLNVEFNIKETNKKIEDIMERAKVLDLEDSLFDLKVFDKYFEDLFGDFEKEKLLKVEYENTKTIFKKKMSSTSHIVNDMLSQLEHLKEIYDLKDVDVDSLNKVKEELETLSVDYTTLETHTQNNTFAYSKLIEELNLLTSRLTETEDKLDVIINIIGSMHDDEVRARGQLGEVKNLLKNAKALVNDYSLPILPNSYYVELKEASEAMGEIVKELHRKPLMIDTLNTRVDTARDLALKLCSKTKDMIKSAKAAEIAIVYGNRYRSSYESLDKSLMYSESLFKKGQYKKSLEVSINSINKIEPGIYDKLLEYYGEKI